MMSYITEFRKADGRRGEDPFVTAALHFVDVRERRLLAGTRPWGLTPVIGGFVGRRCFQDAHIVHTAYRAFFELFLGIYVDVEYVEGLVENLGLVPSFQRERKGHVYYVLEMKHLRWILQYVEGTHEYTPLYQRGIPRSIEEVLERRTVGLSPRYAVLDGAEGILEEAKNKQMETLVFLDMDEPQGARITTRGGGHTMFGIDPFLLEDMDGIRCWLNNMRYKLLQALTKVSRKVVRQAQTVHRRAVFALTRRAAAVEPSVAIVAKYTGLAEERRDLERADGGWFRKKLTRVVPANEVSTAKRTPAPTLEIIEENVRDE